MNTYSIARVGMEDFVVQADCIADAINEFCLSCDIWRLGTRRSNKILVENFGYFKIHKDNYSKGVYKVVQ